MRSKRSLAQRLGAVAGVVVAGLVMAASPAMADTQDGACNSGEVCLYDNTLRTGSHIDFYGKLSNYSGWHFLNSPYWLNDNIESGNSKASLMTAFLHVDANYSGTYIWLSPGQLRDFLPWQVDAKLSSHYWD